MTRRAVVAASVAVLLLAPSASAKTIRLDWRENVVIRGERVMRLYVDALTVVGDRWAVRLSFTNSSPRRLSVLQNDFALALYGARSHDVCRFRAVKATSFGPPIPRRLDPGDTWRGVFGGRASLPRTGVLRVLVGSFAGGPRGFGHFGWLTDHVYDLAARRGRLSLAPPCT